jgi:hypothetical protein
MKKNICLLFMLILFNSCYSGLDDLPTYSDADILSITFEMRWEDPGTHVFKVQNLINKNLVIDKDRQSISLTLEVPPVSGGFPESIRNATSLNKLILISSISTAATIAPVGNTPKMGVWGDFSQSNLKYMVTAADGTKKEWTMVIINFEK